MNRENFFEILTSILLVFLILLLPYAILVTNISFNSLLNEEFSDIKSSKMITNVVFYFNGYSFLDENFFSEQAIRHMKDVKSLIFTLKITTISIILVFLSFLFYFRNLSIREIIKNSFTYFNYLAIFLILAAIFFNTSFENFHETMFNNDDWSFNDDDTIVNLYTENFFQAFFITCSIISYLLIFSLFLLAKSQNKYIIGFFKHFSGNLHK